MLVEVDMLANTSSGVSVRFGTTLALLVAFSALGSAADPVLGTWTLNPAKSSYKPGPTPRGQTRVYQQTGAGTTRVRVSTVNANGTHQDAA